jgi:hypothetical protein
MFKNFIRTPYGKIVISLILGFGLSTLFRKSCSDKKCIVFKSPPLDKIKDQVYKYDEKCYLFEQHHSTCKPNKKTVMFA